MGENTELRHYYLFNQLKNLPRHQQRRHSHQLPTANNLLATTSSSSKISNKFPLHTCLINTPTSSTPPSSDHERNDDSNPFDDAEKIMTALPTLLSALVNNNGDNDDEDDDDMSIDELDINDLILNKNNISNNNNNNINNNNKADDSNSNFARTFFNNTKRRMSSGLTHLFKGGIHKRRDST